jgi:hypothetical protein
MTRKEYNDKLDLIKQKYDNEINKLRRDYALSNNPYRIGDIIEDAAERIKIEEIGVIMYGSTPICLYYGSELRKSDNSPKTNGSKRSIWQVYVKRKIEIL